MSIMMAAMAGNIGGGGGSGGLIVSVSPDNAIAYTYGSGSGTTNPVTASVSNGVGPFLFVWGYLEGPNADFIITSPNSPTTTFSNSVGLNQMKYATYRVSVTDSVGNTGSAQIQVGIQDISFDGGGIIIP